MKKFSYILIGILFFAGISMTSCLKQKSSSHKKKADPKIISAHTAGVISRDSTIRIRFVNDMVDSSRFNLLLKKSPVAFNPDIKGIALWTNSRTLEFRPHATLPGGQSYVATVTLSDFMEPVGSSGSFSFKFSTMKQSFEMTLDGLRVINPEDLKYQTLSGQIKTADTSFGIHVEKMIQASQTGKPLPIEWVHADNQRDHRFIVGNIIRDNQASSVLLEWTGEPIGVNKSGERKVDIPSILNFKVLDARAVQGEEQFIEIRFSDPLKKDQSIEGLIRVNDQSDFKFTIDHNIIRIYTTSRWSSKADLNVATGIRNMMGTRLSKSWQKTVTFEKIIPQVRFAGKGVIIPTSQNLTLPIEAVNLRSVIVKAMRIYDRNILQFLQVNTLEEDNELERVGRVIWEKTIPLHFSPDKKNQWQRYGLDINPLVRNNPAGMFRISLEFKRQHIVYKCSDDSGKQNIETDEMSLLENWDEEQESSSWDSFEEDSNDNDWNYYEQRKNPCHPAFYRKYNDHDITVSRNVLISDIGLIAKKGSGDDLLVVATDIKTTKPLSNVELTLFDYQQQKISVGTSNDKGMTTLNAGRKPFLLAAQKGDQNGYLKLDDGSALSVSNFDISGHSVKKGLKGFIYGERGVWRPGDPIYLTFILMDSENRLPDNHPVILDLMNPRGQLIATVTKKQSVNGFYAFEIRTAPDALTGNWIVKIKAGGAVFQKVLKVETIMPNRLKIKLDFGKEIKSLREGAVEADLSATWLHGAVAKNLYADMDVTLTAGKTTFPKYEHYVFDDPVRTYQPETQTLFEGRLDDQGKAVVTGNIHAKKVSPGMLAARFRTKVYEPGGAFSSDRFIVPFHPYDRYIGIRFPKGDKARGMLLTDTDHRVHIVLLDAEGNPVQNGRVEVKLYKIKWRWWWEKGQESLANYIGRTGYKAIQTAQVPIENGEGGWMLRIKYPSWGRYLVRVQDMDGDHITGKIAYIDWPGWAGRAQKDMPGGATVLAFTSDKQDYRVGETVVLTIPTGKTGRGLVSIESGSRILKTEWIEPREKEVRFEFETTPEMTPNVYAHVTFLQPHQQTVNDLPIRMYGVIPIKVEDPTTRLNPRLTAPDVMIPEKTSQIIVREENGQPMTYTVAVVDEGLLDLTRFLTPDPWSHFYKRETLGVKTWDLFDMVAGYYGGKLEQLLAIGGDAFLSGKGEKKANRFPPMVRFLGPFELEANGENIHDVDVPQYVGSVRVMVVAGQKRAFGMTDTSVFVRKPLMILSTLPRVLGPEENVDMPVSVFAMDDKIKNVTVRVKTNPLVTVEDNEKALVFSGMGDQLVNFKIRSGSKTGTGSVEITAEGHGEKVTQRIEFDIRHPGGSVVEVVDGVVRGKEKWQKNVPLPGMVGTNDITLEVSRIPPLDLNRRLKFLIRYPHGCVEQVTSSVFPQLFLNKLLELSPKNEDKIQENVKAGINKLRAFQTTDGGFGYWPNGGNANEWASCYAGHFLVEAEKLGYILPVGMMDQWEKYQRTKALSWVVGAQRSELLQAYRLYTLSLYGAPELGAMNRLKETKGLSPAARWRLAAAYWLSGQPEAAEAVIADTGVEVAAYRELSHTFGSDLRDKAMIIETLCLMNRLEKAFPLVKEISQRLSSTKWLSTQETAFSLIAMARIGGITEGSQKTTFTYSWNGMEKTVTSASPVFQAPLSADHILEGEFSILNSGDTVIYPRLILEGIPAVGQEKGAASGMHIHVVYKTMEDDDMDPTSLVQGTEFIGEVTIRNTGITGKYEEVALNHLIPSGWEIHNARMDPLESSESSDFDYQDIRDDRIYTYFDIESGQSKTFRVLLNASYLGKFYLPMVEAEAMYDATIHCRLLGRWITVVKPEDTN